IRTVTTLIHTLSLHDALPILYMEPLTVDFLKKIIQKERPDALLPTLGGQTGLNLAIELDNMGILEKYEVELLGTSLEAIQLAERSEEHTSELQSRENLVCRLL